VLVVGRRQFASQFRWFLLALLLTAASAGWYAYEASQTTELPGGGSFVGLVLGTVGAAIILFEMLIWPRKRFARFRTLPLIRTKFWMKAHIWLGLLVVPVAVLHSGFRFGGLMTTTLMVVFLVVIVSGIWGLFLQHVIPRLMLELVPEEVPEAEIERVMVSHTREFERALAVDRGKLGGPELPGTDLIGRFFEKEAQAYLLGEKVIPDLRSARRSAAVFAAMTMAIPTSAHPRLNELRALCDLRRQFDIQARLHWWLHSWVWVHLPLSVALVGLLVAHIYTALRFI
jgi:hypothetical protein